MFALHPQDSFCYLVRSFTMSVLLVRLLSIYTALCISISKIAPKIITQLLEFELKFSASPASSMCLIP